MASYLICISLEPLSLVERALLIHQLASSQLHTDTHAATTLLPDPKWDIYAIEVSIRYTKIVGVLKCMLLDCNQGLSKAAEMV